MDQLSASEELEIAKFFLAGFMHVHLQDTNTKEAIESFFSDVWSEGQIRAIAGAWSQLNLPNLILDFVVSDRASEEDEQKLRWLVEFLSKLVFGEDGISFYQLRVAKLEPAHIREYQKQSRELHEAMRELNGNKS